jgi:tetratricopeptide (TPR) repeat protein
VNGPGLADEIAIPARGGESDIEARVPLRLAVTRGALGLELYEPVELGPLDVTQLVLTLPGLKFPLDLSGGVPVFRNRRGELERLSLSLSLDALARFAKPHLNEVIGPLLRLPAFWCAPPLLSMGLVSDASALAFDLVWAPVEQTARFIVSNARAAGLSSPALAAALRAVDALFGPWARRQGRIVEIDQVALRIGRALLPAIGARAPAAARVRFGELSARADMLEVELDSTFPPPGASAEAARALELGLLVREGDDVLARGQLDAARRVYLQALEQAPRHPELSRLIAEIDVVMGDRTEAALALIAEAEPVVRGGVAAVELLAQTGQKDAAREAARHMLQLEPYGPLAALTWRRVAQLEESPRERLMALDQGVTRSPALAAVRWDRFSVRLEQRDVEGALADAEHLEAGAVGSALRHEVCRRAATALLEAGLTREAGKLFERALRYVPRDAAATAGLGRAFRELGRNDRALALLERAIALGEASGDDVSDARLDLARLLASAAGDLPQAIARVRQISVSAACVLDARGLEARWRATLGDVAGASLAFARLREALELTHAAGPGAVSWLVEAARFERDVNFDPLASERHLAVALRLAPHDADLAASYREAALRVAELLRKKRQGEASG